jgi:hypothetical protein
MSIVSSLNRQNRVYSATVETPAADGTSTILYASIGNFPNEAKINQIEVTLSTGTLTNPTVYILNNGARHKKAPTALYPTTAVRAATTTTLPSTAAIVYNNGASGVGATLTRGENGSIGNIDGVNIQVGDRILVKNQASALQNGIYTVTAAGSGGAAYVLTRATDADTATTEMRYGLSTTVTSGTLNSGKTFFMNNSAAITMGTTALTWIQNTNLADTFVEGSSTGTASGQSATITFNPGINYTNEPKHSDCLNLAVSMAGPIPSGGKFKIDVEYIPLQEFKYPFSDETPVLSNHAFRVLRQPNSGNATDITMEACQNINPYGLGGDSNSLSFVAFNATTDYLYIGSTYKFSRILIHPHALSYVAAGTTLTLEYWNGAWTAMPQFFDNTSDQQATASTLSYAGTIEFDAPGDWVAYKLSTDPMTVYENAIIAGTAYPPGMFIHPLRYFVRLKLSTVSTPVRLVKALILKD